MPFLVEYIPRLEDQQSAFTNCGQVIRIIKLDHRGRVFYFGGMINFQDILRSLVDECPDSLYTLSDKAKVTRQAVYDWMNGRFAPSRKKLAALLDAMQTDKKARRELFELLEEARVGNPKRRSRKSAVEEKRAANRLEEYLSESGALVEIDPKFPSSLVIEKQGERTLVSVYLTLPKHEVLFTKASEGKLRTSCKEVLIVTRKVARHRFESLFEHHRIRIVEEETLEDEFGFELKSKAPPKSIKPKRPFFIFNANK